jgi:hypothetical protein
MEGEAHFFFPAQLMMGTQLVPVDAYPRDYYTTDDWTTQSIAYVKALRASSPTKPFLLYLAHNAVHAPLQAKPGDLAKYRGRYDAGWNALREARLVRQIDMGLVPPGTRLPPSDPRVPDWDTLSAEDRDLFARHMEAYAAMLDSGQLLPKMLVPDVPIHYAGYSPENFDRRFRGAVPADVALAQSLNVPAVRLLREYGVERFYDLLRADVARGLRQGSWRFSIDIDRAFWGIL